MILPNRIRSQALVNGYRMTKSHPILKWVIGLVGLPVHAIASIFYLKQKRALDYQAILRQELAELKHSALNQQLRQEYVSQYEQKQQYFKRPLDEQERERVVNQQIDQRLMKVAEQQLADRSIRAVRYQDVFQSLLRSQVFVLSTFIPGLLLYSLLLIYQNAFSRFIFERIMMTFFVIIAVIVIVFTILYISPSDAAANILGESATMDQRMAFNRQYGLDQPYLVQLWQAIKGILSFDLGHSFTGNEVIMTSITNRFPVTLTLAISSLVFAIIIAIPIGIVSAAKTNSFWDYSFMFIALIGLSIPSFWQGLIFILTFSIRWGILPSAYSPQDYLSLVMPVIVLGTGLAAAIARMTRSSVLEVMHEDYMITAKAKGLSSRQIFLYHGLRNAWVPIITVIGLQFGVMLGGASVTEKVFNISGLGSYIVDKQFIPDIPAILAGVVYIAIAISVVNLVVDLFYALLNPRIRSQMKGN